MNEFVNAKTVHPPIGVYNHGVKVPAGAEWLVMSGQVGVDAKGKLGEGIRKQAELAFRNVLACLREAGMRKSDLVKFTVYLTDPRHIEGYRAARKRVVGEDCRPASTLLLIQGLAQPEMLIEIDAIAAKG